MFIKVKEIKEAYPNLPIKGIIHIGAHEAEEYDDYKGISVEKIIWVEANPDLIGYLENKFNGIDNIRTFNEAIYDEEKLVSFKISNNLQSSSILNLKEHKNLFPDVHYVKEIQTTTKRFDNLCIEKEININDYNFLNVDVQGADLNDILSFGDLLNNIDFIYSEVNTIEVYEGCHTIDKFDEVMLDKGFQRVMTHIYHGGGWGDALYIKSSLLS
jgi:FkbM family methyltransferase